MIEHEITVIGGGLAGSEAAWQAARHHARVRLYEMRPLSMTPAHTTDLLAELVCSNSFRSAELSSAIGLLKEEMRRLNSLIMEAADRCRVPAGKALAVDRQQFAGFITEKIKRHPAITVERKELTDIPSSAKGPVIVATGPLTSPALTASLQTLTGCENLAFYDAIAPIVHADSLDLNIIYSASRYEDGPGDYLNCPFERDEYYTFINAVNEADKVPLLPFEKYFEGCLPIEVMLARGDETLRFGPMKPVGLSSPKTGREPYAVVQLRKENLDATLYNMVGFQTKLTYPEQKRVFRLIPGMEKAEFARLGSVHRNTFVRAPEVLLSTLQCKNRPELFLAGQLTGVEGYLESTAMGLLAGLNAVRQIKGQPLLVPPPETALGALVNHLTRTEVRHFQPSNVHFGLFPSLGKKIPKKERGARYSVRALTALERWMSEELREGKVVSTIVQPHSSIQSGV